MTSHVFANGREVLCGASTGQVIAAFPDVCLSPPGPPAGPIPIPYPNFAKAADVASGSRQVKIKGKPLIKRETSYIKKITGDEAATRSFGGSVITHTITGTAWFQSWSPNVFVEGEEVVRHLDLCTTNHASKPGSTPPMPAMASATPPSSSGGPCDASRGQIAEKCDSEEKRACPDATRLEKAQADLQSERDRLQNSVPRPSPASITAQTSPHRDAVRDAYQDYSKEISQNACRQAMRCELTPYNPSGCCPPQTPHHVVDVCSFLQPGQRKLPKAQQKKRSGCSGYDQDKALCVCAEGNDNNTGTHGLLHLKQRQWSQRWTEKQADKVAANQPADPWTLSTAVRCGVVALRKVFPLSNCDGDCLTQQLLDNHQRMGIQPDQKINRRPSGAREQPFEQEWKNFNKAHMADRRESSARRVNAHKQKD